MAMQITVLVLLLIVAILGTWAITQAYYNKKISDLKNENEVLKLQAGTPENIVNQIKAEFSKIAQESLKNQQEQLLNEHSTDLQNRIDLFKAEEINPINKLIKEFKDTIDNY